MGRVLPGLAAAERFGASDDRHRQNHIAVLAAHIHIPQAIIGDAPDEINHRDKHASVHPFDLLNLRCALCLDLDKHGVSDIAVEGFANPGRHGRGGGFALAHWM